MKYFISVFLIAWLFGWGFGWAHAFSELASKGFHLFLAVWLIGWTIGGLLAMFMLYRLLHPGRREVLVLAPNGITYDSGTPPLRFVIATGMSQKDVWRSVFPKRQRVFVSKADLVSMKLRDVDSGNRLTVDVNAERIDIARAATEVERERIAALIQERYLAF